MEEDKEKKPTKREKWILIVSGVFVGAANGFLGGGGGMVCVPVFTELIKMDVKHAHASAILAILPLSAVSAFIYALSGAWNMQTGLPAGIGVICGGVLGALLLKKLPQKAVGIIFALLMIAAGARMTFWR